MRMGFLYDRRFDLGNWEYPSKEARWSSHKHIEARVPKGAKVLDIGCGKGLVAGALVKNGCQVSGVDILPVEETPSFLSSYLSVDLNREPGRFFEWLRGRTFDYIVMGDIIEHLVDPETFLERLRESLPSGQPPTLIVSTGNVAFFIVRIMLLIGQFNYAPRGILDRTHTRLFTKRSFSHLFQQCGYEVLKRFWSPLPFSSISGRVIFRWVESLNYGMALIAPSAFAYQMIFEVRPLPTTTQIMKI
jgi:2-polyprenyl-3-methyl-5-hydroxy-6-metoxy-1,4-benzoquinol methylase